MFIRRFWKLFWDLCATALGLYMGYRVFLFTGNKVPVLGYFPLGLMFGLIILWMTAYVVHAVELLLSYLLWKFLGVRTQDDLPFD